MKGLSIDIGVHNMAFYIEEFDVDKIKNLSCPKILRYDKNLCSTDKWKSLLEKVYSNGKKIFLDDFKQGAYSHTKGFEFWNNHWDRNLELILIRE